MKSISSLVRAAAVAFVALGASALVPASGSQAQAQYGWSHGGHRVQHHRVKPRHVYRYHHVQPRRVYHRPVVRHYGPRYRPAYYAPRYRHVYHAPRYRQVYHAPRYRQVFHAPRYRQVFHAPRHRQVYHAPRFRPVHAAPVYYGGRRCVVEKRWVHTHYGPQFVRQRVCYRGW